MPKKTFYVEGGEIGTYPLRDGLEEKFKGYSLEIRYGQKGLHEIGEGTDLAKKLLVTGEELTWYSVRAYDPKSDSTLYFEVLQQQKKKVLQEERKWLMVTIVAQDEQLDLVKETLSSLLDGPLLMKRKEEQEEGKEGEEQP